MGSTFFEVFVLVKLPYPHCYLWNKIQMPTLKLLREVKMDSCFIFAATAQLMPLTFIMCFHSNDLFQRERMALDRVLCLLSNSNLYLHDHAFAYSEAG